MQPSESAVLQAQARLLQSDRGLREALVMTSVTMIALAMGIGLYVQFGLAFWLAMVAALAAYAALISVHVLIRRSARIMLLDAEVRALRAELKRSHGSMPETAARRPEPAGVSAVMPPPLPAVQTVVELRMPAGLQTTPVQTAPPPQQQLQPQMHGPEIARMEPRPEPNTASFEKLQGLIKRLADDVGGPRAASPDPDRWAQHNPEFAAAPAAGGQAWSQPGPASGQVHGAGEGPAAVRGGETRVITQAAVQRIAEAIAAERVDVFLEPIHVLGDRRARHFEVAFRFRDQGGREIAADDVTAAARSGGLSSRLDLVKLPRVARVAHRVKARGRPADVLATFAGTSLADDAFLDAFASEVTEEGAASLVMTFSQADVRGFGPAHWEALGAMTEMGVRFALEEVTDLGIDFEQLKVAGFAFVKLDWDVFLDGLKAPDGVVPPADVCRHLSAAGLALIVARIEDEWAMARVMGFGVVLGQGSFFGAPRPVRADILNGEAVAA